MTDNIKFEEMKKKALVGFIREYEDTVREHQAKGIDIQNLPTPTQYLDDTYSACRHERELLSPVCFVKRKVEEAVEDMAFDLVPVLITTGVTVVTGLANGVLGGKL